jgi:hypothetical protein
MRHPLNALQAKSAANTASNPLQVERTPPEASRPFDGLLVFGVVRAGERFEELRESRSAAHVLRRRVARSVEQFGSCFPAA